MQTKELVTLTVNFGVETCILCSSKGHMSHQLTMKDESWRFLCKACSEKLATKINKQA